mmetsp:Transcript_15571/g.27813  ORF Transcript_15571/g.27813 Transcript_15571/m.27813 type:complete len:275 (-) Transcript_15571:251-1075(-)
MFLWKGGVVVLVFHYTLRPFSPHKLLFHHHLLSHHHLLLLVISLPFFISLPLFIVLPFPLSFLVAALRRRFGWRGFVRADPKPPNPFFVTRTTSLSLRRANTPSSGQKKRVSSPLDAFGAAAIHGRLPLHRLSRLTHAWISFKETAEGSGSLRHVEFGSRSRLFDDDVGSKPNRSRTAWIQGSRSGVDRGRCISMTHAPMTCLRTARRCRTGSMSRINLGRLRPSRFPLDSDSPLSQCVPLILIITAATAAAAATDSSPGSRGSRSGHLQVSAR